MGKSDKRKLDAPDASKKKSKKSEAANVESVITPSLLTKESRIKLRSAHDNSGPYTHVVLDGICSDEHLRAVHEEVTDNLDANLKETDLYRVYQTAEVGRIQSDNTLNRKKLKHLLQLRDSLYSREFRSFVEDITGCTSLNDTIDCSCNAYAHNCHLLCHDDVITTRAVAYIIYLTEDWDENDGGALELYPCDENTKLPLPIPTKSIVPKFNTMGMFVVQQNKSYHSVQEVFTTEKPRISLSGWYHTSNMEDKKIELTKVDSKIFTPIVPYSPIVAQEKKKKKKSKKKKHSDSSVDLMIDEEAVKYLKCFINPIYVSVQALEDINTEFVENSSIQLRDFLIPQIANKIEELCKDEDKEPLFLENGKQNYYYGISANDKSNACNSWSVVGPTHIKRHLVYSNSVMDQLVHPSSSEEVLKSVQAMTNAGELLQYIRTHLFQHAYFNSYLLKLMTELDCFEYYNEVRRFRPGLDYTVAHSGMLLKKPLLDCNICFAYDDEDLRDSGNESNNSSDGDSDSGNESNNSSDGDSDSNDEGEDAITTEQDVSWEGGDVGGYECYIETEEEEAFDSLVAAEVGSENKTTSSRKTSKKSSGEADDNELITIPANSNVFSLVLRDEEVMKFIKYVNSSAPGSRWDIDMELNFK